MAGRIVSVVTATGQVISREIVLVGIYATKHITGGTLTLRAKNSTGNIKFPTISLNVNPLIPCNIKFEEGMHATITGTGAEVILIYD